VLEEVARRERSLLAEELEGDVAGGCLEDYFCCGLGLEVVEGSHFGWFCGGNVVECRLCEREASRKLKLVSIIM
jgi:hypothetical protein